MQSIEAVLVDPASYEEHLNATKDLIPFHHVYAALKYYKDGCLEEGVKLSVFHVSSGEQRFYCVLHELLEESLKVLMNTDSRDKDFLQSAVFAVMDKSHPILNKYDSFYCAYVRQDIRDIMFKHPKTLETHPFRPFDEPNITYYIGEEKCNLLKKMDIQLPNDYYWVTLTPQHAEQVCAEQIYTSKADEKFVALRIRTFPAVGVAYKPLGELAETPGNLACYEYSDGLGVISLLYCQKAHRGKGLATLVEQKICQRNIVEQGITPYKGVSINRPRVVQMTAKSGLWTACLDQDQKEELHFCSVYSRKDLPRVVIYED